MKDNKQSFKSLLQQALRECPTDFALSEARYHLHAALSKVEQVEKKRARRHQNELAQYQERWGVPAGVATAEALQYIDAMIAGEQRKIDEITERRKKQPGNNGDDVSAILG
jgi:hypothetical protein